MDKRVCLKEGSYDNALFLQCQRQRKIGGECHCHGHKEVFEFNMSIEIGHGYIINCPVLSVILPFPSLPFSSLHPSHQQLNHSQHPDPSTSKQASKAKQGSGLSPKKKTKPNQTSIPVPLNMNRHGASSRHYDSDSASDTDYDYYPRSGGPSRRSRPAHRGPTLGHGAHSDPYTSDDSDSEPGVHHHNHHHGHVGGARGADTFDSGHENDIDIWELVTYDGRGARGADLFSSDEDSDIEPRRPRHVYGRGRAGASNRDEPPVVRMIWETNSHPARFARGFSYSSSEIIDDDQESECEHHAARGGHRRRLEMRFDTDSSDENGANLLSRGSYGFGGRGSTAHYPPRRGRDSSSGESASERYMASSRRGRGTTGAGSRGGVLATPTPPLRSSHGRAQGEGRGGVRGDRP